MAGRPLPTLRWGEGYSRASQSRMPADPRAVECLIAFWVEAGVDVMLGEAPNDRIAAGLEALRPKPAMPTATMVTRQPAQLRVVDAGAVAAAGEASAAAADLAALEAAIAAFEGCELKRQGARQAVFAHGNPDAEVMVIGE